MATPSTKPTILLIQGAFQLREVYQKLTDVLKAKGYPVVHPQLPSLTNQESPDFANQDLTTDTNVITSELRQLITVEERNVVVVMHSYGGLVGSNAVLEDFSWKKRNDPGSTSRGGVIHLFYFAAFALAPGQSVLSAFGKGPNDDLRPGGRFRIKNVAEGLYGDLAPEEAEYWASKIIDQSYTVQSTKLTNAAYQYIPSTYLVCTKDQALPPTIQEAWAQATNAKMIKLDSGHSPMLSRTEELAELITEAADEATRTLEMGG